MNVRTTVDELARWLEKHGGTWTVEGEPALARSLPVPAPGAVLAEALRGRGGHLAILAPDVGAFYENAAISYTQLREASFDVDGMRVFQLAWLDPDGTTRDSWLLAESDALSRSGQTLITPANATNIMNVLQNSRVTVPRLRKPV
jgi:hypothetical protein